MQREPSYQDHIIQALRNLGVGARMASSLMSNRREFIAESEQNNRPAASVAKTIWSNLPQNMRKV